ncbi:MraY family glycosyltransferase [Robertkochia solimangrovi]|uniref:MraY family glycosyltransferase n=1 Tax=Robertkochia solimangrovi TaxID=2213046 RepID=UPI00117F921B|nr:MraY family glycosyltransferase [Robertkochia solimangrovi]TRZ45001.1 undecaprenyl/decaprenyl-phosphate alpha-N-acetylglucosaminyl 1-phosphate transferase [Robertkochia solimangrovi]
MVLIYTFGMLAGGFLITYYLMPKILQVVKFKNFTDVPGVRSSHSFVTPTLGGITFFITLIGALFFLRSEDHYNEAFNFIPALTLLFIMGLKDDLVVLGPRVKLLGQLGAMAFLLLNPAFTIHSLYGFMGIYEIPYFLQLALSVSTMIVIINAVNLIDGIDGLAGMQGIVILGIFSGLFFMADQMFYFYLGLAMIGCLAAFLCFNLSKTQKIFMGDTGSMILGFIIGIFTIRLLAIESTNITLLPFDPEYTSIIAMSVLFIPLYDTARVFFIRLKKGVSPFKADRSHVHHILVDMLHFSHRRASAVLSMITIIFTGTIYYLSTVIESLSVLFVVFLCCILTIALINYQMIYGFGGLKKRMAMRKRLKSIYKLEEWQIFTPSLFNRNAS